MKTQAESVSKEYDRLCEEHNKLEKKLQVAGGDKKEDWFGGGREEEEILPTYYLYYGLSFVREFNVVYVSFMLERKIRKSDFNFISLNSYRCFLVWSSAPNLLKKISFDYGKTVTWK